MGIFDDLEAEQRRTTAPDPWADSEDKLEEWLGIVPEGTMPDKPKPEPEPVDPDVLTIKLTLANDATDIYTPQDFKNSIDYARAIKIHARKIPQGFYAGYIIEFTMGDVLHRRRIAEPVRDRAQAFASPEFTLAVTKAIPAIQGHKKS